MNPLGVAGGADGAAGGGGGTGTAAPVRAADDAFAAAVGAAWNPGAVAEPAPAPGPRAAAAVTL